MRETYESGKQYISPRKQLNELPTQEPSEFAHTSQPVGTDFLNNMQPQTTQKEWLMICLDGKLGMYNLYELAIHPPMNNVELFEHLSTLYKVGREPFKLWKVKIPRFWKCVKAIHFVRFCTLATSPMRVQIEDMQSRPSQAPGWVCGTVKMDETVMAYFLHSPKAVGKDWSAASSVYKNLPRKLNHPLPAEENQHGWGLYFEESWDRRWKLAIVGVVFTIAYVIRGLVSAVKGDEAFGMTIAGNNLMWVGGVVAALGWAYM
jgi:hypothetical protein